MCFFAIASEWINSVAISSSLTATPQATLMQGDAARNVSIRASRMTPRELSRTIPSLLFL